jgi:cell division protein FtsB
MRAKKKFLLDPIKQNLVKRLSNTNIRFRRTLLRVLLVLVGLFLLNSFFSGNYGFIRMARLHVQKNRLIKENQRLLVDLVDADLAKKRLSSDLRHIEYIARSRYYFSRPNEIIYRFTQ